MLDRPVKRVSNAMKTVDLIICSATEFYEQLRKDENGRYRSWEYCYGHFMEARQQEAPDVDHLSLQLAFYLASWGMYRGSSFLLQKDYRIHIPVVRELLNPKYNPLAGIECIEYRKTEVQDLLKDINAYISNYYNKVRLQVKEETPKNKLSDTLITKVLMGTLGCVPAYDRYFITGLRDQKVSTGLYNMRSLLKLVDFYEENKKILEAAREGLKVNGMPYPQMKLLDMGFWQIGFELDTNKGLQVAH